MIACLSCGRPLINGSPKEPTAAAEVRAAMSLHNCPRKGHPTMTNPKDQCSRCDAVSDLLEQNITTLEDCASVIGCPTPSLHVHLVQHDRDDLLRGLTYQGEPILEPKSEEATLTPPAAAPTVLHAVADDVVTGPQTSRPDDGPSCACDAYWFDDGETEFTDDDGILHTEAECGIRAADGVIDVVILEAAPEAVDWPEDTDPQELVDAGLVTPEQIGDECCDMAWRCILTAGHDGYCSAPTMVDEALRWLHENDPDDQVQTLVGTLLGILQGRAEDAEKRALLAHLVEQRDALNREIEELAQRLGDLPASEPEPVTEAEPEPKVKQDGGSETALIREWARSTGRKVSSRGTLPRELVDAYREAHA